jgi:hypothetical protein
MLASAWGTNNGATTTVTARSPETTLWFSHESRKSYLWFTLVSLTVWRELAWHIFQQDMEIPKNWNDPALLRTDPLASLFAARALSRNPPFDQWVLREAESLEGTNGENVSTTMLVRPYVKRPLTHAVEHSGKLYKPGQTSHLLPTTLMTAQRRLLLPLMASCEERCC